MLATNIAGLRSRLVLAQHPNDPLFREPRLLHLRLPQGDGFYPFLEELAGLRSIPTARYNGPANVGGQFRKKVRSSRTLSRSSIGIRSKSRAQAVNPRFRGFTSNADI